MEKKLMKPVAPDHLTMHLFAPGMSALHRAGLGGLACTLQAMQREHDAGRLPKTKLPAPFADGVPPWQIAEQSITLRFGKPEHAETYLQRLFEFAFAIRKDGLIYLPGQHFSEPGAPVLADLQLGLTVTFLQHGRVRALAKEVSTVTYDPEGDGNACLPVEYHRCTGYKHQKGWQDFLDKKKTLTSQPIRIDGPVSPGTVVRHVAFTADTGAADPAERMLPLYFAAVGCPALPVNRGVAVLLVPEVQNLIDFVVDRPLMTPTTSREAHVPNAADAALQTQLRLRAKASIRGSTIPGCYAMTFMTTPWAKQQKSRVTTIHVPAGDEETLQRFSRAIAHLPPRIKTRLAKTTTGKDKQDKVVERFEAFRVDSIIRPLIAENLALKRKWYAGFARLMSKTDPATGKPYRRQLPSEKEGIHAMISDPEMWDCDEGEALVVQAVHETIRRIFGRIREETDGKPGQPLSAATKNRWDRFQKRLRLDLAGAKTLAQLRFVLADLFSRGGKNAVLQEAWEKVLPVIRHDWQLARDLGLLALASYTGCEGEPKSEGKSN